MKRIVTAAFILLCCATMATPVQAASACTAVTQWRIAVAQAMDDADAADTVQALAGMDERTAAYLTSRTMEAYADDLDALALEVGFIRPTAATRDAQTAAVAFFTVEAIFWHDAAIYGFYAADYYWGPLRYGYGQEMSEELEALETRCPYPTPSASDTL